MSFSRSANVPMDSSFYSGGKTFFKNKTYSRGDYGPPADGVEYRKDYDPVKHDFVTAGNVRQPAALAGVGDGPGQLSLNLPSLSMGGVLNSLHNWYLPSTGPTWGTVALWVGSVVLVRKLLR